MKMQLEVITVNFRLFEVKISYNFGIFRNLELTVYRMRVNIALK